MEPSQDFARRNADDEYDPNIDPNEIGRKRNRKNFEQIKRTMQKTEPDVIYENIKRFSKEKSSGDIAFIMNCLKSHFVFHNLSENDLEDIIPKMFYAAAVHDEYVFKQGDNASSFFIVENGTLDVYVNEKFVRTIKKGDGFGELALLYNAPRSASIKAKENCFFWGIDRHTFRSAIQELTTQHFAQNRAFIDAVTLFNSLTKEQKDGVAGAMIIQKFKNDEIIVNEGDPSASFYIIKEGSVQVIKQGTEIRRLGPNDSFGEQVLYDNTIRQATIKAIGDVKCLALSRENLTKILGDQFKTIMFKNLERWAFERNKLFSQLTKIQIEKILEALKLENYQAGAVVYTKGSAGSQKIIVILEGAIKKASSQNILVNKGEAYGSEYLFGPGKDKLIDDDLIMVNDGIVAEISLKAFTQCIGGPIEEILLKNEKSHEKKMMNQISELKNLAGQINLDELIFFKKLGSGQFGSVYLVQQKGIEHFFALKSISKAQVYEQDLEKYIMQEKAVLEAVNFPFILQFIKTFKDPNHLYFLTEYVKGMELFDVIREIGLLGTIDSQFYIGSMILAIEYLHAQNIIYRDLKPENIMIDQSGYLKLIDMGTAKFLNPKKLTGKRTFTIIGTPHYMAPEVLSGKGYGFTVDLWSIGVCLYEFMCGMVPFGEDAEDPYDIYEEIITKPIKYPKYLKDLKAKALMGQLLSKTPETRLGDSFATLKANPWFESFDWDKLLDRELKPPYVIPNEKIITDSDIKKMSQLSKKVLDEINEEEQVNPKTFARMSSLPTWDQDF